MKKYAIPVVVFLAVIALTWSAFGQAQDRASQRGRSQNMNEEERAKIRERLQNMSEEQREKFRAEMRERGGSGRRRFQYLRPEDRQMAVKTIEAQLAKYKAVQNIWPTGGDRDLSEDERAKLREKMTKVFQDRQKALQAIIAQIA
ncbi:MAG: hypothetical protein ACYS74_01145, partial [Planctomycetota bacterium]